MIYLNDEVEELEVITIIKKIRYKNIIWIPESESTQFKRGRNVDRYVKQNYFVKWLHKNKQVGDIFTLEDFYKEYPKHKENVGYKRRVEKAISNLIRDKIITHWDKLGEFKRIH